MTTTISELQKARSEAADSFFENYDTFEKHGITLDTADEWNPDGPYWSRKVYGDGEYNKRVYCSFGIEFKETSAIIVENWLEKI